MYRGSGSAVPPEAPQVEAHQSALRVSEDEDRVRAAYGANYQRLSVLKKRYNPTNLFRVNQNVAPSA